MGEVVSNIDVSAKIVFPDVRKLKLSFVCKIAIVFTRSPYDRYRVKFTFSIE